MASHIWQRKTTKFSPVTVRLAKGLYDAALKVGYSPIESARFASNYIERKMQGNAGVPLSRAGYLWFNPADPRPTKEQLSSHKAVVPRQKPLDWQLGVGVHASEFLYFRIIGTPLPEDDGRANLPHVMANIQRHKPKDYTRISAAMAGVDAVAPSLYIVKTAMASCGAMHRQAQLAWAQIKRGRDLFIPGFGSFDINAAVDWVNANPHCGCFSPLHLTAIGYCLAWQVEEQDWDQVIRLLTTTPYISRYHARWGHGRAQHITDTQMAKRDNFVRNINYWRHNIHHLDALRYYDVDHNPPLAQWANDPAGLVAHYSADRRTRRSTFTAPTYNNDQLAYMADWQPVPVNLPNEDGTWDAYTVEAITTLEDLDASAKALRNCSRGYIGRMVLKQTVLCVVRNKRGKRVAMLELSPDHWTGKEAGKDKYCQMRGPCNKSLPAGWSRILQATAPTFGRLLDAALVATPESLPQDQRDTQGDVIACGPHCPRCGRLTPPDEFVEDEDNPTAALVCMDCADGPICDQCGVPC